MIWNKRVLAITSIPPGIALVLAVADALLGHAVRNSHRSGGIRCGHLRLRCDEPLLKSKKPLVWALFSCDGHDCSFNNSRCLHGHSTGTVRGTTSGGVVVRHRRVETNVLLCGAAQGCSDVSHSTSQGVRTLGLPCGRPASGDPEVCAHRSRRRAEARRRHQQACQRAPQGSAPVWVGGTLIVVCAVTVGVGIYTTWHALFG